MQVEDGKKQGEKEYASKGVAGTALGLGIAGTALWLFNGGLGNCGLFGGNGAAVAATASNEQYLERKECEDVVALTNAMWQQAYNAQANRCADRSVINQEMQVLVKYGITLKKFKKVFMPKVEREYVVVTELPLSLFQPTINFG